MRIAMVTKKDIYILDTTAQLALTNIHLTDGMNALFTVEKCPDPVPKDLRHVKTDDDYDGGDEEDGFSYAIQFLPKGPELQARSGGGQQSRIWRHFIAAEEVTWNYAPHLNPTDR